MPTNNQGNSDADVRAKLIEALQPLLGSLINAMNTEHTPEMIALRTMFLRRVIFSGDVIPSRVPAPNNITELGGYLNYLGDSNHSDMALSVAASALGIAVPLSEEEKKAMMAQVHREPKRVLKDALSSTTAWVAVCDTGHDFWSGDVAPSYDSAQSAATSHDESLHNGKVTAVVLSL